MAGPFDIFETDENVETAGVELDYGDFWVLVARAGGSNRKFENIMTEVYKKHKFQLDNGLFKGDAANLKLAEVYADAVVLNWGSKQLGAGKIPGRDGKPIVFSRDAVVDLLVALPALFQDVREQASKIALFRKAALDEMVGNSAPTSTTS